jgi:hypothetical protein
MSYLKNILKSLFKEELDEAYAQADFYKRENAILLAKITDLEKQRPVTISKSLKWFSNHKELRQWLFNNPISERQYKTTTYDCDDYATDLKLAAEEDGYRMDIQWDLSGRFDPTGKGQPHALNSTRIGNTVYIIEPQKDSIVYEGRID